MGSHPFRKSAIHGSRMGQLTRGNREWREHIVGMAREDSGFLQSEWILLGRHLRRSGQYANEQPEGLDF
jgi:hypothetical protein